MTKHRPKNKLYVFGNPLLANDNLPLKLVPLVANSCPNLEPYVIDPNENLHPENGNLYLVDTVIGIDKVTVITDIDNLASSPNYSLHDLDLAFNLKLLKKLDKLHKVAIFGVPSGMDKEKAGKQLIAKLHTYFGTRP